MANLIGRSPVKRCGSYQRRSIELRSSFFQQRSHQLDCLEFVRITDHRVCPSTNFLHLSDEYLHKCHYATFTSTPQSLTQNEFDQFLKVLFSCSPNETNDHEENELIRCDFCQNRFHSKETFDLHFQRESVSIEYRCLTCQRWIQTRNPCEAFLHLLKHEKSMEENRLEQLTIHFDRRRCLVSRNENRDAFCLTNSSMFDLDIVRQSFHW